MGCLSFLGELDKNTILFLVFYNIAFRKAEINTSDLFEIHCTLKVINCNALRLRKTNRY